MSIHPNQARERVTPRMARPSSTGRRDLVTFALGCSAFTLILCLLGTWWLDVYGMESSVGLPAQYMLRTGQWIVPRLYGAVFAYKPALTYWLTAPSLCLFGSSQFALRLPTALCAAALGMATLWLLARLVSVRCGLYAYLVMVTSALFVEQGRIAGCDMPLALGVGVAILGSAWNLVLGRRSPGFWLLVYAGLLFAFLAKGMPALGMFIPGLVVSALFLGQLRELVRWQHLVPAVIAGLLGGLYLYLAWQQAGAIAIQQQWGEVATRGTLWNLGALVRSLLKPLVIFVLFLPGSALLLFYVAPGRRTMPARARRLARFFWCFLLTSVAVWIITPTYTSRYYLPLVTPIAVLAGLAAEAVSPNAFRRGAIQHGRAGARWSRERLRHIWATYHPGIVVTFWGVLFWIAYANFIQPAQAAQRLELRAVDKLASHLAAGDVVYVDVFVVGSSPRRSGHLVLEWNPFHAPPAAEFLLILQDKQEAELRARSDLQYQILATAHVTDSHPWMLARVSRRMSRRGM